MQTLVGTGCGYCVHSSLVSRWFMSALSLSSDIFHCNFWAAVLSRGWGGLPVPAPVLWLYLLPCLHTSETLWLSCRKPLGFWQKWKTAVSEMCSTRVYRSSDLELLCLQTMITEAKQGQAAFKRCNKSKQACTSLFLDAFIAAMAWKWGCN